MFHKLQVNTEAAKFLARSCNHKAATLVLFKLVYMINRRNIVKGTPVELAKAAGVTLRDFNLGIQALKNFDLVRKYTRREYMLNPDVLFNGSDSDYYMVKHMWDQQTTQGLRKS